MCEDHVVTSPRHPGSRQQESPRRRSSIGPASIGPSNGVATHGQAGRYTRWHRVCKTDGLHGKVGRGADDTLHRVIEHRQLVIVGLVVQVGELHGDLKIQIVYMIQHCTVLYSSNFAFNVSAMATMLYS